MTHVEVLRRLVVKRELSYQIKKQQLKFLGHITRRNGIESNVLTWKIKGKRARGKHRYTMRDNALRWIESNYGINNIIHQARDRGR